MAITATTAAPIRILVIDDEKAVLHFLKVLLGRAAYTVTTAESGEAGMKILEKEIVDCIITDAAMPGMDGYEVAQHIRRHPKLAHLPVLMLTRKRNKEDVKKAVAAGVTDYLMKPIDESLLLDKVELCVLKGTGKRHIYELPVNGSEAAATAVIECQIVSLSEGGITVSLPLKIEGSLPLKIQSKVFDQIGIDTPVLKLVKCEEYDKTSFHAKYAFVGVNETDLKKIRAWIQKETIRRRK